MTDPPIEQRTHPQARIVRLPEVQARTGLSRSTIYVWLGSRDASPGPSRWVRERWAGSSRS